MLEEGEKVEQREERGVARCCTGTGREQEARKLVARMPCALIRFLIRQRREDAFYPRQRTTRGSKTTNTCPSRGRREKESSRRRGAELNKKENERQRRERSLFFALARDAERKWGEKQSFLSFFEPASSPLSLFSLRDSLKEDTRDFAFSLFEVSR